MSFQKFTAEITFTALKPLYHSKTYTDFDIYRKFDDTLKKYVVDDDKMITYFEQPFQDESKLFKQIVKGDSITVGQDEQMNLKIKRHLFNDLDITQFNYAKVKLIYDETKAEEFYCWVIQKNVSLNDLSFLEFTFGVDYIPTFYNSIKEQLLQGYIDRRSFFIYKSNDISVLEEQKRRLERKTWNIECDNLCKVEDNLYYNHHFKSLRAINGQYVYLTAMNDIPEQWLVTTATRGYGNRSVVAYNNFCTNPPCSLSLSPLFSNKGEILTTTIPRDPSQDPNTNPPFVANNFLETYKRWILMGGNTVYDEIKKGNMGNNPPTKLVLINWFELEPDLTKYHPFQVLINESDTEQFKYNEFKNAIPHHFQELHTKYIIRSNQDDVNEIPKDLIFLRGFNGQKSMEQNKWVDDITLQIFNRPITDNIYYDVYFKDFTTNETYLKPEFTQLVIKPILSFNCWSTIYFQAGDLEKYLRSNKEQRKIAQQAQVKDFLVGSVKATLGGAVLGLGASKAIAAVPFLAGLGLPGFAIGAGIALAGFAAKYFIDEATGTSERAQREAREKDLENGFNPPLPSEVGGNFLTIYSSDNNEISELKLMHPLGFYVTEVVGFASEWKYKFEGYDKLGISSQKVLNNLIQFGEKCNYSIKGFNLFDFIVNNKTDQSEFYIHFDALNNNNDVYYSNIFTTPPNTYLSLLQSGIRFHFKD